MINTTMKIENDEQWRVAALAEPNMDELKRVGLHSFGLSLFVFILGVGLVGSAIGRFPYLALSCIGIITFPFCILAPLGAKLFRNTSTKMLQTVFWSMFVCMVVFIVISESLPTSFRATPYVRDGLPEELMKFVCGFLPLWLGWITDSYSLVFSAFIAGLSFGILENVLYVARGAITGIDADVSLLRFVFTPLLHASFAMFPAVCVGSLRLIKKGAISGMEFLILAATLLVTIILHGSYNLFLTHYEQCGKEVGNSAYDKLFACAPYSQGALAMIIVSLALPFIAMYHLRRQREQSVPQATVVV